MVNRVDRTYAVVGTVRRKILSLWTERVDRLDDLISWFYQVHFSDTFQEIFTSDNPIIYIFIYTHIIYNIYCSIILYINGKIETSSTMRPDTTRQTGNVYVSFSSLYTHINR